MTPGEDPSPSLNPLQVLRRRGRPLLYVSAGVLVLAVLAALLWPPRYGATGEILIEQQELPTELVRSTISSYASERVQVITQRVMTTENLMGIIQRYNLYPELRRRQPREKVIKEMRRDTALQMISADVIDPRDGRPTKATIAFSISYSSASAELAAKVANELVSLYLQQNIESRQQTTRDAAVFLAGESDRLDKDIKALQARIADFKEKHEDELPELSGINEQRRTRLEEEIRDTDAQLRSFDQQLTYLDAQLAQISPTAQVYASTGERVQSPADRLKYVRTEYARVRAIYAPDHPDVQRLKRELDGLEAAATVDTDAARQTNDDRRQLQDATTQLASARQRYAADHPDVQRLERLVASLQSRVPADQPAGATAAPAASSARLPLEKPVSASADNPPYIQVQSQREAAVTQIHSLSRKRSELEASRAGLDRHMARTPAVERDYNAMMRDLDSAQAQYRQVREKQMEAQTAQNLEVARKGERFTLIEPPLTPEEPTSPNRGLILGLGLIVALMAGLAAVAALEKIDSSVRGRADLVRLLSVPPLAAIPLILTGADRERLRRRRVYALAGGIAGVLMAIVLIHLLYRPLDVLWAIALRRFGFEA